MRQGEGTDARARAPLHSILYSSMEERPPPPHQNQQDRPTYNIGGSAQHGVDRRRPPSARYTREIRGGGATRFWKEFSGSEKRRRRYRSVPSGGGPRADPALDDRLLQQQQVRRWRYIGGSEVVISRTVEEEDDCAVLAVLNYCDPLVAGCRFGADHKTPRIHQWKEEEEDETAYRITLPAMNMEEEISVRVSMQCRRSGGNRSRDTRKKFLSPRSEN